MYRGVLLQCLIISYFYTFLPKISHAKLTIVNNFRQTAKDTFKIDNRSQSFSMECNKSNIFRIVITATNVLCHLLVLFVTSYLCCLSAPGLSEAVNIHAMFLTLGVSVKKIGQFIYHLFFKNFFLNNINEKNYCFQLE